MIETTGIKAFKLLPNGDLQTGGIGGSKKTIFKVGETYTIENDDPIELCKNGFHFYREKDGCFGVGLFGDDTVFHKIVALGDVVSDTEKLAARTIKVCERVDLVLDGHRNSGDYNSGDLNSGDYNSGDYNSGDYNSGDLNSGNYNSGDLNSGNYNSGNCNSGDCNSGNGYRNYFCEETKYFLFDAETTEETVRRINRISMSWFNLEGKTYKGAWLECPDNILDKFRAIPEFQTEEARQRFKNITGLDL